MRSAARVSCAAFTAVLLALLATSFSDANPRTRGQANSPLTAASSVARPHTFISVDEAPAGHSFEVAVVVDILSGYHMNSHKPMEDYLIPTTLKLGPSGPTIGTHEVETTYPDGQMLKFEFSHEKLSVYTESVTIRMKLAVDADAPTGIVALPLVLHYQACNMSACLPPVSVNTFAKLKIAPADVKPHALHPEIFKSQSK